MKCSELDCCTRGLFTAGTRERLTPSFLKRPHQSFFSQQTFPQEKLRGAAWRPGSWAVVLEPALGNIRPEVETSVRMKQEAAEANSGSREPEPPSFCETLPWKLRAALFPAEVRGDVSGQRRYLFAVTPRDFFFPLWVDLVVEKWTCLYFFKKVFLCSQNVRRSFSHRESLVWKSEGTKCIQFLLCSFCFISASYSIS